MNERNDHEDVLREIEVLGILQAPRRITDPKFGAAAVLEGNAVVEGRELAVRLVLDSTFPNQLPRFYLVPWDALGFIPHVDPYGQICFLDPEGLVLDRRHPVSIIQDAFCRAMQTLSDGVSGRNRAEFVDEWEVYWARLASPSYAVSIIDPSVDEVQQIVVIRQNDKVVWVANHENDLSAYFNEPLPAKGIPKQYGLYIPLRPGASPIPPRPDGPFWTAIETRDFLLEHLSETNRSQLYRLTKRTPRKQELVIVGIPRPSGGTALFGIGFDDVSGPHPLRKRGAAKHLTPIVVERRDRGYLVVRGGGDTTLGTKRVLLVGCGAVGGHIAIEVARAGIQDLTVVDSDQLLPENSFRHALGRIWWSKSKAQAIKESIEVELPFVRVTAIFNTIEAALAGGSVDLTSFDLVVLALGNPTVELAINERLHAMSQQPIALYTWLEPLGIGGHALLTGNAAGGCLECLYTAADESQKPLLNRAAFAGPDQSFGRALSGCGSLHTPYGSMDAVQTANMATRLAIRALVGDEPGNPLLSWKGESRAFEGAGYRLSSRYNASTEELWRDRYDYRNERCQVCGERDRHEDGWTRKTSVPS